MINILLFIYLLATCRVVFIKNLEKEDWRLLNESDSDASNFIYHEKMRPDVQQEVCWDITDEVVNEDFPQGQSKLPSVDVSETSRVSRSAKVIVRWMLIFLCLWSLFCSLSDNAFELLLVFLRAVFDSMRTMFPLVASFAVLFPRSVMIKTSLLNMLCALSATVYTTLMIVTKHFTEEKLQRHALSSSFYITGNISVELPVGSHF